MNFTRKKDRTYITNIVFLYSTFLFLQLLSFNSQHTNFTRMIKEQLKFYFTANYVRHRNKSTVIPHLTTLETYDNFPVKPISQHYLLL